jgi:hypothetical protein
VTRMYQNATVVIALVQGAILLGVNRRVVTKVAWRVPRGGGWWRYHTNRAPTPPWGWGWWWGWWEDEEAEMATTDVAAFSSSTRRCRNTVSLPRSNAISSCLRRRI